MPRTSGFGKPLTPSEHRRIAGSVHSEVRLLISGIARPRTGRDLAAPRFVLGQQTHTQLDQVNIVLGARRSRAASPGSSSHGTRSARIGGSATLASRLAAARRPPRRRSARKANCRVVGSICQISSFPLHIRSQIRCGRDRGSVGLGIRVLASAVTSADIRASTSSSPGPDVVFNSSAARRNASRRNKRAVIASNSRILCVLLRHRIPPMRATHVATLPTLLSNPHRPWRGTIRRRQGTSPAAPPPSPRW